jgi:hypothetical protein
MSSSNRSLCITCGRDADVGTTFNRMPDGTVCPACAERLLEMVPPPFPGFGHMLEGGPGPAREDDAVELSEAEVKRPRRGRKGNQR